MAIKVGIHEGVQLEGFVVNEYGSGEVKLIQKSEIDVFEALQSGQDIVGDETVSITLYPVKVTNYQGEALQPLAIINQFRQLVAKLTDILAIYLPVDQVKFNMFEGTSITKSEDINVEVVKEETAEQMNKAIFGQFASMLEKADLSTKFRIKLPRQSAAKHFPTIPNSLGFTKDGRSFRTPFIELASIPKEQSKLAWTKYEEDKGLNNPDKVVADTPSGATDLPFEI